MLDAETFIVQDGYTDRSGARKVFLEPSVLDHAGFYRFICFDIRNHLRLFPTPTFLLSTSTPVFDVRILHNHDGDLRSLVRRIKIPSMVEFMAHDRCLAAHTRAISAARIDVSHIALADLVPSEVLNGYMNARLRAIRELFDLVPFDEVDHYRKVTWPIFIDMFGIEDTGIRVDVPFVTHQLERKDVTKSDASFFRHTQGHIKNGFVRPRFDSIMTKTGRWRSAGGFNCMGIPHGDPRRAIISRFEGGRILTIDFNAIDFRCLVSVAADENLRKFYEGSYDFHFQTSTLFEQIPNIRDIVKRLTYVHIYGGSRDTLQRILKIPQERIDQMVRIMDEKFKSIGEFRHRLGDEARKNGFLRNPAGLRVPVDSKDHDGKIIGLYAQSHSSSVFDAAVHETMIFLRSLKSRLIFTVYDEIVVDVHPDEGWWLPQKLNQFIEESSGFVVKSKEGMNYEEATRRE